MAAVHSREKDPRTVGRPDAKPARWVADPAGLRRESGPNCRQPKPPHPGAGVFKEFRVYRKGSPAIFQRISLYIRGFLSISKAPCILKGFLVLVTGP